MSCSAVSKPSKWSMTASEGDCFRTVGNAGSATAIGGLHASLCGIRMLATSNVSGSDREGGRTASACWWNSSLSIVYKNHQHCEANQHAFRTSSEHSRGTNPVQTQTHRFRTWKQGSPTYVDADSRPPAAIDHSSSRARPLYRAP